jgi:hypothetical protein
VGWVLRVDQLEVSVEGKIAVPGGWNERSLWECGPMHALSGAGAVACVGAALEVLEDREQRALTIVIGEGVDAVPQARFFDIPKLRIDVSTAHDDCDSRLLYSASDAESAH